MIFALVGCLPPAALYPVDPCRVGAEWDAIEAEATCSLAGSTVTASFDWSGAAEVGGRTGEGWDGLSFYIGDGALDVGWRPGVEGRPGTIGMAAGDMVVGFDPRSIETPDPPGVAVETCTDAGDGDASIRGLPEAWVQDGEWRLVFEGGDGVTSEVAMGWPSPWPSDCALHPRAWATSRFAASCEGAVVAEVQFLAPSTYVVALDELGRIRSVDARWDTSFDARCGGDVAEATHGALAGEAGALRMETEVLSLVRESDAGWRVETTDCGVCPTGWAVTVEGLPAL